MALVKRGDYYQADQVDVEQDLIYCNGCGNELYLVASLDDIFCGNCGSTTKRSECELAHSDTKESTQIH